MRKVKITKISDDKFNGNHPNGINTGYVAEGSEYHAPKVGESYGVYGTSKGDKGTYTSTVTEIIDENTFKTRNSTYKIETIS